MATTSVRTGRRWDHTSTQRPPPPAPAPADPTNHDDLAKSFAKAITDKQDWSDTEELATGIVSLVGLFMAGAFDKATGKFKPAFPIKTAALIKACLASTKNEHLRALKRVANSNNRVCPENSVMATHRDMEEHDTFLLEASMLGNWAQTILQDIFDKHKRANFLCFFPLLAKLKDQLEQEDAKGFWDDEHARSGIVVETGNFSVETLKSALANFVSLGTAFFVSTDTASLSKAIHYSQEYFRLLIEQDTKSWLRDGLTDQDALTFANYCVW
ncbi:hypothetical protein ACHAWF_006297 [Thalassiosira exigua]